MYTSSISTAFTPNTTMDYVPLIFRTLWELMIRVAATIRQNIIAQRSQLPCAFEPYPHEPTLYDVDVVLSALAVWLFIVPLFWLFICSMICNSISFIIWEHRWGKRWLSEITGLDLEDQVEVLQKLYPDLEIRVRPMNYSTVQKSEAEAVIGFTSTDEVLRKV
ncbi:hypothetical protein VTL71DRAFT_14607 [Oculimacula yallundae]|uniref:Uncharacterized protein n=1 Tax=Oculimacula yallundae TaxID=86028 RepID=A0ABR4CJ44_9HELO